jgi:hypothetical protein
LGKLYNAAAARANEPLGSCDRVRLCLGVHA